MIRAGRRGGETAPNAPETAENAAGRNAGNLQAETQNGTAGVQRRQKR